MQIYYDIVHAKSDNDKPLNCSVYNVR